jgi:hypothetical protein
MTIGDLDTFIDAYIECALWSSSIGEDFAAQWEAKTGEEFTYDTSLESFGFAISDVAASGGRANINASCEAFVRANREDLADIDARQAGHDFWLTRNHHGAGFWDRGLGDVGTRLTESAHTFGDSDMYVGDDERIYVT